MDQISMAGWYYSKGEGAVGPIHQTDLQNLVLKGDLDRKDYVWSPSYESWKAVGEVAELEPVRTRVTPLPPVAMPYIKSRNLKTQRLYCTEAYCTSAVTPPLWLRSGARLFDLYFCAILFCLIVREWAPGVFNWNPMLISATILAFCMIWEAAFLWRWGMTPGKWFIASSVVGMDGHRLSFKRALSRSFLLCINGCGFGKTILTVMPGLSRHPELAGDLIWDRLTNCIVTQDHLPAWRVVSLGATLTICTGYVVRYL